ncbi:BrnT family toxin [Tabrizicola sp.]|uniref:BrnT family toxin n=1 Tax=Tabrizicola sp. TaxID=2005166 RepID=UPI002FDCF818
MRQIVYTDIQIEFDPAKDEANIAKHGVTLARAADLDMLAVKQDERFDYGEMRFRAWGLIDGLAYCLAFTTRDDRVRAISLRRVRAKELKRHAS